MAVVQAFQQLSCQTPQRQPEILSFQAPLWRTSKHPTKTRLVWFQRSLCLQAAWSQSLVDKEGMANPLKQNNRQKNEHRTWITDNVPFEKAIFLLRVRLYFGLGLVPWNPESELIWTSRWTAKNQLKFLPVGHEACGTLQLVTKDGINKGKGQIAYLWNEQKDPNLTTKLPIPEPVRSWGAYLGSRANIQSPKLIWLHSLIRQGRFFNDVLMLLLHSRNMIVVQKHGGSDQLSPQPGIRNLCYVITFLLFPFPWWHVTAIPWDSPTPNSPRCSKIK